MKVRSACALALVAVCAAGCEGRVSKTVAPVVPVAAESPRDAAVRLAGRGDYAAAEAQYRTALSSQPDDMQLHFGLASALSHLDRRDDAIQEFRWVVVHGPAGRPEVDGARRWLSEAGVDAGASATTASTSADSEATGRVEGKLTWPDIPSAKHFGIRVVLERTGGGGERKSVRSELNGTYAIDGLPDGAYKLTGLAGPVRVWTDVPVTVSGGQLTTLDLTPANASVSPAEFPVRAPARS